MKMQTCRYAGLCILRGVYNGSNESVRGCGVQLVEDQYLVAQWHLNGLKIDVGCYALTTEQ